MNILSKFGERLKEYMDEQNINSSELAKRLGIDRSVISRYISGERIPNYHTFMKILNYFNCSADYILGVTDFPSERTEFKSPPEFSERLRFVISACGSSQYKLEKEKGFPKSEIYGWLSQGKLPNADTIYKLATALECSADFLLGRID